MVVNAQSLGSGFEDKTLRKVHAYCTERRPNVTVVVTYLHNKGSHHARGGTNDEWRRHMTMAVTSRECYTAVASSVVPLACDTCGLLFQAIPSPHFPGNFWTARCDYIRQLWPTPVFADKLQTTLAEMDNLTQQNILTRQLYNSEQDWTTGRGRYGAELWVASHPDLRPCDVSASPDLRFWKTSPRNLTNFHWHVVPRRTLLDKHWQLQPRPNATILKNANQRLTDYHLLPGMIVRWWRLYGRLPPNDSWVWKHMPEGDYWRDRVQHALHTRGANTLDPNFLSYILKGSEEEKSPTIHRTASPWVVFYHIYLPHKRNVTHIIHEQLSTLQASYAAQSVDVLNVYFSVVGSDGGKESLIDEICQRFNRLRCILLDKSTAGNENLTLASMHEYCQNHPDQSVLYFHSKGSFHDSAENQYWRRHLLSAITSADCLESVSHAVKDEFRDTCDVCGLQFYPVWAFFFPGNFFVSKCSYIAKLLPPQSFSEGLTEVVSEMNTLKAKNLLRTNLYNPKKEGNLGLGRYAWEHWVGSHPSIRPCDISPTANFRHWVKPQEEPNFEWSLAPRQDIWAPWYRIQTGKRKAVMVDDSSRLHEYFLLPGLLLKWTRLYQATPPADSWIWKWFPDGQTWQHAAERHGASLIDAWKQAGPGNDFVNNKTNF